MCTVCSIVIIDDFTAGFIFMPTKLTYIAH